MKIRPWVPVIALALAAAAAVTGLVLTRDPKPEAVAGTQPPGAPAPAAKGPRRREWLVDEQPLRTARQLELRALTREEKDYVSRALKVANHEMDLAFTDALRQATENPPAPTPESREKTAHKEQEEASVKADQARLAGLAQRLAAAGEPAKAGLEPQLDVAKAQLELDQDELDQATEDLERVGGDPQARIRRLQAAHVAVDAEPPLAALASGYFQPGSLLGKLRTWTEARAKVRELAQARQDSLSKVQVLAGRRQTRAQRVEQEQEERERTKQSAAGFAQGQASGAQGASLQASLRHYMEDQRMLSDLGRRMQDTQELAEIYDNWGILASDQERAALHVLIRWCLGVLLIMALVTAADRTFEHMFIRLAQENRRVGRLFKVVKYATIGVGAVAILVVLVGPPSQVTTLFGLAGAGLTVALKDFIVAFFGWFILVGRNGIHVGDWVEIQGVGGEVVEIGLLRTMLMETGSWSDNGHPTGRIVSFVNSFAMEGHFFNFSTSGQWMWDELQTLVPAGQDPYPVMDAIQKRVEQETEANAGLADREWLQSGRVRQIKGFSARPSLNVVPMASGVEIRIRYITRAYERHETRSRLNQALVELLHGRREAVAAPGT